MKFLNAFKTILTTSLLTVFLSGGVLWADEALQAEDVKKLASQLKYQTGDITLPGNIAVIKLNNKYKFLDQKQAKIVLEKIWGNPESDDLGLLVPSDFNPLSSKAWAIQIYFSDDGYVNDEDAGKLDYSKLLKDMQKEVVEANEERKKQNYPAMELIGWATAPRYDKESHKMFWAKELKFEGDETNTLNYNIRILGRKGVLVLNAISGMNNLETIEKETPSILSMTDFTPGNKYSDFNKDTDKIAGYGIAALIAGGLAAKVGLFKGIWLAILAFKKVIVYGLIAVGGAIASIFKKKKQTTGG